MNMAASATGVETERRPIPRVNHIIVYHEEHNEYRINLPGFWPEIVNSEHCRSISYSFK